MKTLTKAFFATSLCLVTAVPVYAGHYERNDGFRDRMQRQHTRIEHGIENGDLSRHEAKELKKFQRRIRHLAREFREDGYLSKRERRKLNRKLNRVSDQIWEYKHNDRSRHEKSKYGYDNDWHDGDGWSRHRHSYNW